MFHAFFKLNFNVVAGFKTIDYKINVDQTTMTSLIGLWTVLILKFGVMVITIVLFW